MNDLPSLPESRRLLLRSIYEKPTEDELLLLTKDLDIDKTPQSVLLPLALLFEEIGYPSHLEHIKPRMKGLIRYFNTSALRALAPLILLQTSLSKEGIAIVLINDAAIFRENITLIKTIDIAIEEARLDKALSIAMEKGFRKRLGNSWKVVIEKDDISITMRRLPASLGTLLFGSLSKLSMQNREFLVPDNETLLLILVYTRLLDYMLINRALQIDYLLQSAIELSKDKSGINWQSLISKGKEYGLSELLYLALDIIRENCPFLPIPEARAHNNSLAKGLKELEELKRKKEKASGLRRYLIEIKISNVEYRILRLNAFPELHASSKREYLLRKYNSKSLFDILKKALKRYL